MGPDAPVFPLTALDHRLVAALSVDGRATYRALADACEVSADTVRRRMGRLFAAGMVQTRCEVAPPVAVAGVGVLVGSGRARRPTGRVRAGHRHARGASVCRGDLPSQSQTRCLGPLARRCPALRGAARRARARADRRRQGGGPVADEVERSSAGRAGIPCGGGTARRQRAAAHLRAHPLSPPAGVDARTRRLAAPSLGTCHVLGRRGGPVRRTGQLSVVVRVL
ncbi:AsnC family transcriptional regulator [Streptomyces aureus]